MLLNVQSLIIKGILKNYINKKFQKQINAVESRL